MRQDGESIQQRLQTLLDRISDKLQKQTGALIGWQLPKLPEKTIWQDMQELISLELRYQGELPKRGFIDRLSEGRKSVMVVMMSVMLLGYVGMDLRSSPWLSFIVVPMFFGAIGYSFYSFRKDEEYRLDKELTRVREELLSAGRRTITDLNRLKQTKLKEFTDQQKNKVLKTICPTLKVCMVTSEMLFPEDKILLEKQFGVPVVNEYGASELDLIAFENRDGEWQVNAETLFVEILDENNQAVPNGTPGRIVITSLFNKAHPFIRYDLGDIGILDEKSTAKKPVLKQLIGRTNDVAQLPSGKKSPGLTFYYVTKSIIEDDGTIKEFIIKQTQIDTFEIEYVSQTELTAAQIQKIESAIALYLESGLVFSFIRKEKLERSHRGKLKQFTSFLKSK